jgi:hypothetical protein
MAKGIAQKDEEILSPEQVAADTSMADIYFLAVPRVTLERINGQAQKVGLTAAQAIAVALEDWLKKVGG